MSVILNSPNVVIGHMSGGTININNGVAPEPSKKEQAKPQQVEDIEPVGAPPEFFRVSEKFSEQNIRDRLAADLKQSTTKIEYCRALYRLQHMGCINIDQYTSDEKRAKVLNEYQSRFNLSADDFYRARLNK